MNKEEVDAMSESSPDQGADLLAELDKEISNLPPENNSEVEKTPASTEPRKTVEKVEKYVPYDRFQEVVKENKRLKETPQGTTSNMDTVKLVKALEGHSEDEIDFITRNAKSSNVNDIISASKDEWVKDAIQARRKKEKDSKKIPGSSTTDFGPAKKDWQAIKSMPIGAPGSKESQDFEKFEAEQLRDDQGI